jgi:hypothetical protein
MKKTFVTLWNKFVSGFETGIWNVGLIVVGVADNQEVMSLQSVLPEKLGQILMIIGIVGFVLRYMVTIGWIKPFKEEE